MIPSLEKIDWHSFLARPPLPAPAPEIVSSLIDQPILITGAGGSIGAALALRLVSALRLLVLDYTPGSTVLAQRSTAIAKVSDE